MTDPISPDERAPASSMLDRYRLIAELGRGGMADVYLAVAAGPGGFSKLVVIKHLRSSDDPILVAMFLDEAKLAARISHANVVQTYEVVHEPDTQRAFMVMEFLDGPTLSKLRRVALKRGHPIPLALELLILRDALTGLHAAHELKSYDGSPLSVVHRDFTPQNLIVTYSGEVKIVDFGIAKALDQQAQTSAGMFKGKLTYVPPEQLMGHPVDRRADIFAAGIVLYEAITGDSPWKGMTNAAITHALATGSIPRLLEYVGAPPELAAICDQAMAVDPDDRYPTALAFRDALDEFIAEQHLTVDHAQLGEYVSDALAEAKLRTKQVIEQQMSSPSSPLKPTARVPQSLPLLEGVTPSPVGKVVGRSLPSLMASTALPDTGAQPITQASLSSTAKVVAGIFGVLMLVLLGLVAWLVARMTPPAEPTARAAPASTVAPKKAALPAAQAAPAPVGEAPTEVADEDPPTVPVAQPVAPQAALPTRVAVRIRVSPRQARVTLDGKLIENPFDGTLPADTDAHRLRAVLAGYEELQRPLELERDVELELALSPVRRAQDDRPRTVSRPPPPPPATVEAPPPPARAVTPTKGESDDPEYFPATAPKKKKRSLENDIEF